LPSELKLLLNVLMLKQVSALAIFENLYVGRVFCKSDLAGDVCGMDRSKNCA
jgi:hypothetical protein